MWFNIRIVLFEILNNLRWPAFDLIWSSIAYSTTYHPSSFWLTLFPSFSLKYWTIKLLEMFPYLMENIYFKINQLRQRSLLILLWRDERKMIMKMRIYFLYIISWISIMRLSIYHMILCLFILNLNENDFIEGLCSNSSPLSISLPPIDLCMKNFKKIAEICNVCISMNIKDIWGTVSYLGRVWCVLQLYMNESK